MSDAAMKSRAPTKAMIKALKTAANRERANICPIIGVYAGAETVLLKALDAGGYIAWDGPVPRISAVGRSLLERR